MRKKFLPILLIAALVLSIATLAGCTQTVDDLLKKTADEANKQCPMTVDSETRMDSVQAAEGKILQYNYTMVNYAKSDLTADQISQLQGIIQQQAVSTIKASADSSVKALKALGVTFQFVYNGSDGVEMFHCSVTPDDYK